MCDCLFFGEKKLIQFAFKKTFNATCCRGSYLQYYFINIITTMNLQRVVYSQQAESDPR